MKNRTIRTLSTVLVSILLVTLLASCQFLPSYGNDDSTESLNPESTESESKDPESTESEGNFSVAVSGPTGENISILSKPASDYVAADKNIPVSTYVKQDVDACNGSDQEKESYLQSLRYDRCVPLSFSYTTAGKLPDDVTLEKAELYLSTDSSFAQYKTFAFNESNRTSVQNLVPDTRYSYKTVLTLSDSTTAESAVYTFSVEKSPRLLCVDGLGNVRDIGGYESILGGSVRYGMIYRGTEFDGLGNANGKDLYFTVTAAGKETLLQDLSIRTDIDLRKEGLQPSPVSPLGNSVSYHSFPISSYTAAFSSRSMSLYADAFKDILTAIKVEKPVYIHCTYGADRTGTLCFLLEALLGMREEDLIREYELSGLFYPSMSREQKTEFQNFLTKFKQLSGNTVAEKAETYWQSAGITAEQIASFRAIMLEE